jgi:hypothetical protein
MPAPSDRRPDFRSSTQLTSELAPEALFDLLADPSGCLSWHVHPKGVEITSVDAPPGAALEGAEFATESTMRGVPVSCRTTVLEAIRPRVYSVRSELTYPPRIAYKRVMSTERYLIEAQGTGSRVSYETTVTRELRGFPYLWPLLKISDRFFAAAAVERCFVDLIKAAERHVKGVAV